MGCQIQSLEKLELQQLLIAQVWGKFGWPMMATFSSLVFCNIHLYSTQCHWEASVPCSIIMFSMECSLRLPNLINSWFKLYLSVMTQVDSLCPCVRLLPMMVSVRCNMSVFTNGVSRFVGTSVKNGTHKGWPNCNYCIKGHKLADCNRWKAVKKNDREGANQTEKQNSGNSDKKKYYR